jgi:hypothetical protein
MSEADAFNKVATIISLELKNQRDPFTNLPSLITKESAGMTCKGDGCLSIAALQYQRCFRFIYRYQ